MTHLYAFAGDVILGRDGEVYARLTRNLSIHDGKPGISAFEFAGDPPEVGAPMPMFLIEWLESRRKMLPAEPTFQRRKVV